MAERECEILIEKILQELAHPQIGPATVDEQESLEESELREREVAREDGLHPFLTADADTDVCHCANEDNVVDLIILISPHKSFTFH